MTTYIPSITLPDAIFASPAVSILLPVGLGFGVGYAVQPKSTHKTYLALKQPPYRPPPQVFGPVWTTLYALMGYAAYRAWATGAVSLNPTTVQLTKAGTGYLNNWNFADKERETTSSDTGSGMDKDYVNKAPEQT
ncbi:MAG: hypothetical protein Q9166_003964 [cf. Caloplaca sp. 2 TL-2023]